MGIPKETIVYFANKCIPRQSSWLFERDEIRPDQLTRSAQKVMHGAEIWLRDTLTGRRDPMEILHARMSGKPDESIAEHVIDGFEFLDQMDISDRAANGLRLAIQVDQSSGQESAFGSLFARAMDNPVLADHNHPHNRRVERWIEAYFLNVGGLRHDDSVFEWIDSSLLYAYFHDSDQIISLERNIEEKRGQNGISEINVKGGHSLAAAVMILALHKRYGTERVVRTQDAWRIAAGAAYMMLRHDEPENLQDVLLGTKSAFTQGSDGNRLLLHGEELYTSFKANELDLTTIAPSQIMELLKMEKEKKGYPFEDSSVYGLSPEFEREYADDLRDLANNHQPLFRVLDRDQKEALHRATEVAVRADVMDMIAPPNEAILRSLLTQWSKQRPFFRTDITYGTLMGLINGTEGNLDNDSDTRRLLWEFIHNDSVPSDTVVSRSRYKKKVHKENAIMGVVAFKTMGEAIMRGDYSVIQSVYRKRIMDLSKKALAKTGLSPLRIALISQHVRSETDIEKLMKYMETKIIAMDTTHSVTDQYQLVTTELIAESKRLIMSLEAKKCEYTQSNIQDFQNACDETLHRIYMEYTVKPKEAKRLIMKFLKGQNPALPFSTFDSLGTSDAIRTLLRPLKPRTPDTSTPTR